VLAFLLAPTAAAQVDWASAAGEEEIEILTKNEDGSVRETTIWLVVVDGQGYIRTGGTRWRRNVERDRDVVARIAGTTHEVRAEDVTDAAEVERLQAAFRAKYGFSDRMTQLWPGAGSHLMRLAPR
jgi:hypothetical protein